MANMHEFSTIKNPRIFTYFDIGANEPAHPVIRGDDRGEHF